MINVSHTPLVSDVYLFQSKAEAEAFFDALSVPSATTLTYGVVKQSAMLTYTPFAAYTFENVIQVAYGGVDYETYDRTTIDEIRTKLLTLNTAFNLLLTQLRNAGILSVT